MFRSGLFTIKPTSHRSNKENPGLINSPSDRAPPPVLEVDRCLELLSVVAWAIMRASVSSARSAQDRSKAKPDEVVQTPVVRLSGRAASRATNASAVRAAEIVLTD
jgi:hypothetical protein